MSALTALVAALAVLVSACGAFAEPAGAAVLRVDGSAAGCSDAEGAGVEPARPLCSVAAAAKRVAPGDVVRVAPGRYRGTVRPVRGGTPDAPIRFVADSRRAIIDAGGAANAIHLVGASDVRFEGFSVTGGANQGVWIERSDRVVLSRLHVLRNRGTGVQLKSGTGTVIASSELSANRRAGLLELAGARGTRVLDCVVARNGRDGRPFNGDGLQLGGVGAEVARSRILRNGDSGFEHGIYTGARSSGWRLHDNRLIANAGANIKAAGVGQITGNRLIDGRWGLVLSDNPGRVAVVQNVIRGVAQHLVFLTAGPASARASLVQNTIVQHGRATRSGDASAVFVLAASELLLRNNLVAYTGADGAGAAITINDAGRLGRFASDTNWWAATDARSRHLSYDGRRMTLADWQRRTGRDARSVASRPPAFDGALRVTSTNLGAGRGEGQGITTDFRGAQRPASGPVDIGAYNARRAG